MFVTMIISTCWLPYVLKRQRLEEPECAPATPTSNSVTQHQLQRNLMAPSASGDDLNDEDLELISLIELDLVRLGEVYGFSFGIVKKLYMLLGTFGKTVKFLQALNVVMVDMEDQ